jgi:polysaccharide biosynthesis protein PslH
MRILVIASRECVPPNTGAKLRTFHLARELARRAQVVYLSFAEEGAGMVRPETGFQRERSDFFERVLKVPRGKSYRSIDLLRGVLGDTPFSVLNWTRPEMAQTLSRLVAELRFDIIQIESIQMAGYLHLLRAAGSPALVCDWHNIESEVMRRYCEQTTGRLRRAYAAATARRLQMFERRTIPLFDAHIAVSTRDRKLLMETGTKTPVFQVENGVSPDHYSGFQVEREPRLRFERNRVVYVGSMDYHANVDGVCHFARHVWPELHRKAPELRFTVVGFRPTVEVRALASMPGIEVTGTVNDVRPFLSEALVEVVPLRVAGGTRLKILEAMASRVPVVATPVGAEGLEVQDRRDILLASSDQDFIKAVLELRQDQALRNRLAGAGEALIRSRYDWSRLGAKLWEIHRGLLEGRRQERAAVARGAR